MKKHFYSLFAATAMMLAVTSCSQEEDFGQQSVGDSATFNVSLKGAVQSRTTGDGMTVDKLYYEVYEGATKIDGDKFDAVVNMTNGKATVEIPLMRGHEYTIAFWAQNAEAGIYDATNLTDIKVTYTDATANNEKYDAFFKAITYKVTATATTVELTRPFAQLNIGTTTADWATAKSLLQNNDPADKSEVTVAGLATSFNAFTGSASTNNTENVTFSAADFIGENFTLNNTEYMNLGMNYLLVPGTAEEAKITTNVDVVFQNSGKEVHSIKLQNVPIERNYRTNIIGDLFTQEGDFDVIVKPGFNEEAILYPELWLAAANGGSVTLEEDVILTSSLVVAEGKSMVINLNGHNITKNSATGNFGEDEGIIVYGNLTIEGEGIVQANSMAVWARGNKGAEINIKGGSYKGLSSDLAKGGRGVIYASGGNTINIYGGTFEALAADKTSFANKTEGVYAALNIQDNQGSINVYGGTFKNFNPAKPGTEPAAWNTAHPNGFVAQGYASAEISDNTWMVIENPENKEVVSTTAANLQQTINDAKTSGKPTIIVLKEVYSDGNQVSVPSGADITIIGGNSTPIVEAKSVSEDGVSFTGQFKISGKLTLKDMTIYAPTSVISGEVSQYSKSAIALVNSGDVICENVTFEMEGAIADASAITAWWSTDDGANITVKNCTFNCAGQRPIRSDACVTVENCVFNDPYRYAVQMTSKSSTMDASAEAYVNFYNNTINAGTISTKEVVYGVQLEGETYGCSNLTINGAGNVINLGTTSKTGAMYYCECSKVDHSSITWNTEVAPEHKTGYSLKDNTYYIASAEGLVWFEKQVNESKNNFTGKTIALVCDIDLEGIDWEPIGQTGVCTFDGIFDGQGHTIKNLNVNSENETGADYSSGLFGWIEVHTWDGSHGVVKNLTIDDATINGHHNCAVIAGYLIGTVENCHVKNATVNCTMANNDANGDKAGSIAGILAEHNAYVKDCTANNVTISAGRDAGQIVGAALNGFDKNVTDCSVTNVTVTANGTSTGANIRNELVGRLN